MFASDTNRAQRISRLLEAAQRHGLDPARLLQQVELRPEQIEDPDARVPVETRISDGMPSLSRTPLR